jgi:hypothetical protein
VRVDSPSAPPSVDAETRRVFSDAVKRDLSEADVAASLSGYAVSPSLVQLRRYVESDSREPKLVCIVDLAVRDGSNSLIGSVRGTVAAAGATTREAVEAAVRSAVGRVEEAVHVAQESHNAYARR